MKTADDIKKWAADAQPGDRMIYHVGPHANSSACAQVRRLIKDGIVTSVSRRRTAASGSGEAYVPGDFEYTAIRMAPAQAKDQKQKTRKCMTCGKAIRAGQGYRMCEQCRRAA